MLKNATGSLDAAVLVASFEVERLMHLVNDRNGLTLNELVQLRLNMGGILADRLCEGRVVKHHMRRNRWHRVCQLADLVLSMGEAAILSELAKTCLHKVSTDLCFVVRKQRSHMLLSWEVLR